MRTLLIHLSVPDEDGRSGGEIAGAIQEAIEDDVETYQLEIISAEIVHNSGIRNDGEKLERLARLEAAFEAAGGRGIELADEIDELREELGL